MAKIFDTTSECEINSEKEFIQSLKFGHMVEISDLPSKGDATFEVEIKRTESRFSIYLTYVCPKSLWGDTAWKAKFVENLEQLEFGLLHIVYDELFPLNPLLFFPTDVVSYLREKSEADQPWIRCFQAESYYYPREGVFLCKEIYWKNIKLENRYHNFMKLEERKARG